MDGMKVALIAPPWFTVPPIGYGGVELVVAHLADGLSALGHEVTLFAAGGSRTAATLYATYAEPPSALLGDPVVEAVHLLDAYRNWSQFDVIHDHTMLGLIAGASLPIPIVHTLHGPVLDRYLPFYERMPAHVHLVCISNYQRARLPEAAQASVIYNGIELDDYRYCPDRGEYLLFVGRAAPEKGLVDAIEIARRTRRPLLALVKVNEPPEEAYFRKYIEPALEGVEATLRFQVSFEEKEAAYRGAWATLFPIQWDEPFGLVMAESMAAGTPVIAYRRGSAPEVIDHGVTGFVCDSLEEAVESVDRVADLDRAACRERVARLFSARQNVASHEALYRRIAVARPLAGPSSQFLAGEGS